PCPRLRLRPQLPKIILAQRRRSDAEGRRDLLEGPAERQQLHDNPALFVGRHVRRPPTPAEPLRVLVPGEAEICAHRKKSPHDGDAGAGKRGLPDFRPAPSPWALTAARPRAPRTG